MPQSSEIRSYKDLIIWQEAKNLTVVIYKITDKFPKSELYGLTSQIRRAAVSIPSNIAEGFGRKSKKEKIQFLRISFGSGAELETQLEISLELGYLDKSDYNILENNLDKLMRMLNKAIWTLDNKH